MSIPASLRILLGELEAWGRDHEAAETDHSARMLNLEPETAHLISLLARATGRTRVLEIGTSNGYSTLWLAWSMSLTGGNVISMDRSGAKSAMAAVNLRKLGFGNLVELRVGEADDVLGELEGPFDLVLFDADRVGAGE